MIVFFDDLLSVLLRNSGIANNTTVNYIVICIFTLFVSVLWAFITKILTGRR